jgi:hypothetical protein
VITQGSCVCPWQDVVWEKTLEKKAPPRPPPLEPHYIAERAETKGRFGGKITSEIDLYLKEKQRQHLQFPEREVARAKEEAAARHKIEELHKNYYALMASSDVGVQKEVKKPGESMNLMRNEWYAFTNTGMYRP